MITDVGALLAPFHLAGPDTDPPGAVLAPEDDDDLPRGVALGWLDVADAPRGCQAVVSRIDSNWVWRLTLGEGVCLRQGKGAPRGNGTRPRLRILEPARSVCLRAVGVDEGFPDVSHHGVITWVQLARTGRWAAEDAWAWSREPGEGGRCFARNPRRWKTITEVAGLLSGPPTSPRVAALFAPGDAEREAYAMAAPAKPGEAPR